MELPQLLNNLVYTGLLMLWLVSPSRTGFSRGPIQYGYRKCEAHAKVSYASVFSSTRGWELQE